MTTALPRRRPTRRTILGAAAGLSLALQLRPVAAVSAAPTLQAVERQWAAGKPVTEGRVLLDIAPLVENGNVVPISVVVDSPMTAADHVVEIVVFNERNPQRDVVRFSLSPASGKAQVQTRIRLATSQQLVALARLRDGSQWSHHVDVLVTLAACIEP
ncbi:MAG: SoxY-related AACIE arm protein [Aquabacterium sp.]|nr:SoxY-related AACIE arm protein [Aquabacterium sp.]